MQSCTICFNRGVFKKISDTCGHKDACNSCICNYIEAELKNKATIEILCPRHKCDAQLTYQDVKRLASNEIFERYDSLLLRHSIRKLENFRWCKNPECGSGQEHTTGDDEPIMTCNACRSKSCFTHDVPWHENHTCAEFAEKIETVQTAANQAYHDRWTKKCPECKMAIEKNKGCDHMRCYCGYEFCWLCLAAYDQIRKYGNHHHKLTCQYYSAYHGEDV
ncbi:11597_t:CDS:2 [Ambispora gerdemannii]|uniref:RBR-type E3 ubiquitin transferase n=1 Tax=Ambispora gerdemannii TaxID=144530 RepID=A0A9N9D466_9GLOM|nr:11597_t:CDS:2 [Ambispora gerdemannii]